MQRSRDLIAGELTLDYFMRKAAEGWRLSAVEWVRDTADGVSETESLQVSVEPQEIPYGLRISEDGSHLEQNPLEVTVLMLILEKIVREKRITEIANELNREGFQTRGGRPWSPSTVFDLLPRLIDAGPKLLKSPEWQQLRTPRSAPN
ncbi:MAG: recombinase family protein [Bryobacteraceae bacterium]